MAFYSGGNNCHVNNILVIQKKAVRIISNSHRLAHCRPLFISLKIMTVINLYIYTVLVYVKNNISNLQLRQDVHTYNTRINKNINIPYQRLSKSINSYETLGLKLYNKLPATLTNEHMDRFKSKLCNWLVTTPFYSLQEFFDCTIEV